MVLLLEQVAVVVLGQMEEMQQVEALHQQIVVAVVVAQVITMVEELAVLEL
jgi:hypothetical protein